VAVLEGFHAVKHAVRFGAALVGIVTPDKAALLALAADLAPDVAGVLEESEEIGAEPFRAMAPHPVPTPALAIARRPATTAAEVLARPGRVVLLDRPMHLGNIGAAIRVTAAAGATGVLTTGDRDPWDPACLRGSAGLHFAIGVAATDLPLDSGRPLLAIHPEGEPLTETAIPDDALLAFGSERHGLSPELLARSDARLAIPMRSGVSSLNLATSVAVTLYAGNPTADRRV
jgi:TrmH family RNA methyltransferase